MTVRKFQNATKEEKQYENPLMEKYELNRFI